MLEFSPQIWEWVVLRTFGKISGHSHEDSGSAEKQSLSVGAQVHTLS